MKAEVRDQIVALLTGEMEVYGDNLDTLEGQLLSSMRDITQGTLQAVTTAKKRGTQAAESPVNAARKPAS